MCIVEQYKFLIQLYDFFEKCMASQDALIYSTKLMGICKPTKTEGVKNKPFRMGHLGNILGASHEQRFGVAERKLLSHGSLISLLHGTIT